MRFSDVRHSKNNCKLYMQLTIFSKIMSSEKTKCRKCRSEVKNGDSICCSICNVWHHLRCSGLSKEEFLQHTRNKNLFLGMS